MNVEQIIKSSVYLPLESKSVIHMILVYNKITESLTNALRPFDVSPQQFNVLRILRGQKGQPANMSTINERMVTKMSNTTRLVDKLIVKDLVKRNICKENRRKVEIFITEKGKEQLMLMDDAVIQIERTITQNHTTEELQTLNSLLDKF